MKKLIILSFVAFAFNYGISFARIIRVAPTTLGGALFTNAQAAHDAANLGDTVYLEGISSPLDYGVLTITTPIVVIGQGWNLTESANTQFVDQSSRIANILIRPSAAGTKIIGVYVFDNNAIYVSANNVIIDRSSIGFIVIGETATLGTSDINISGLLIQRCYILYSIGYSQRTVGNYTYYGQCTNTVLKNNIVADCWNVGTNCVGSIYGRPASSFLFENNYLRYTCNGISNGNAIYRNNLFGSFINRDGNFYNNFYPTTNVNFWSTFSGSGNVRSNLESDAFSRTGNSYGATYYKPIVGGVANNAGTDGTDIGPFGGTTPYIPFGIPPLPAITNIQVPAYTGGNTINVTIDAQINR